MPVHRRAVTLGLFAVAIASGIAATAVTLATGRSGREAVVFTRTAKLRATSGQVGRGLALQGSSLVALNASGKHVLATLGGGDEVIAPLTGALTPIAAAGPDEGFVVYSAWRQLARIEPGTRGQGLATGQPVGVPSIRLFDLRTGKDDLLANGAAAPAVSTSGAVAYVAGESRVVRQNVDYTGRVVVADSPDAKPRVWTSSPARYLPYAWAGSELLVYRGVPDSEGTDLYAYSGADEAHLLAPDAFVIAVSPDGENVLAAVGIRTLEVIRVADAAVKDSMTLAGTSGGPSALMYAGSWRGDRVVANSDRGLVVLNLRGGLHVESVFATPTFPHGIKEPVLVDDTHVHGWADLAQAQQATSSADEPVSDNAIVDCDLATGSCAVGPASSARKWARWITNPSR